MSVYSLDPLTDPRWDDLVARHPRASVFHTGRWLKALQWTYGYRPLAFTTSGPGADLSNALVLCQLESWIRGRRFVSLPFSDHCDPLTDSVAEEEELLDAAIDFARLNQGRYIEIRPGCARLNPLANAWQASQQFCLHVLSLEQTEGELYQGLHNDCIRRKLRRAEREHLSYVYGNDELVLRSFYGLLVETRGRHGVPPPPIEWFRNLLRSTSPDLTIRLAAKDGYPVAATLTLDFRTTSTYKYGCSDERYHGLGGMPFLFWKMIQEGQARGMMRLDLGRSDLDNPGLIQFKDRLGARSAIMTYWRGCAAKSRASAGARHLSQGAQTLFRIMPRSALVACGKLLYKHAG